MREIIGGLALLTLLGSADPSAADWLVLEDGARVETEGPWEVRGPTVVFTLPNGTLSSLRTAEVDLEASREATTEAKRPVETSPDAEPGPGEPILVLTDADVSHVVPGPTRPEPGEDEGEASTGAGPEAESESESEKKLEVTAWDHGYNPERGALEVSGSVKNLTENIAVQVEVMVSVLDEEGELLARVPADLSRPSIPPGGSVAFVAVFPTLTRAAGVEFELSGRRILLQGTREEDA